MPAGGRSQERSKPLDFLLGRGGLFDEVQVIVALLHPDRNRLALAGFLAPLEILPFSSSAAGVYGRIRAELERGGMPIGAYDLPIGAQALAGGFTLVTNNERGFRRIPGLAVEDWVTNESQGS